MTAREFFFLVSNMRAAQKTYIKSHSGIDLKVACAIEREVDAEIQRVKEILDAQALGD